MSTGIVNSSEGRPHCASITWTIDAFKDLTGRIESPPIQLSTGTRLKLSLDSKSSLSGDKYITIQLHSYESDFISRITFVKANGTKGHRTGFQQHYHSGDQHITTSYIEGLEVLNMANGYLVDGKLTVHCDVVDSDNDVISNEKHSTFDYHHVPSALLSLLEGAKYSDVTFVVGGKEFAVHKNILASRSPVFDAMFSQEFREKTEKKVKLPDISVEVFERLLRGIYTGQLRSLEKYAEELLAATNKYQVDDLKKQATQFLIPRITTDSAITLLLLADMHQSTELKSECIKYITANLASVKATEGWKHLKENNSKHSDLLLELLEAMAE